MCGIAGWIGDIDFNKTNFMLNVLEPRGPDAFGEWVSKNRKVWFGHRRLKILDLSDIANQPMTSKASYDIQDVLSYSMRRMISNESYDILTNL